MRAAAGAAFRAPSLGELYYPYLGEPGSPAGEVDGLGDRRSSRRSRRESSPRRRASGTTSATSSSTTRVTLDEPEHRPRRTRGVEVARPYGRRRAGVPPRVLHVSRRPGSRRGRARCIRRPRHMASATFGSGFGTGGSWSLDRALHGRAPRPRRRRLHVASSRARRTFRMDAAVTLPPLVFSLAPWVRVTNLFATRYAEVNGFPAPGRRFLAGARRRVLGLRREALEELVDGLLCDLPPAPAASRWSPRRARRRRARRAPSPSCRRDRR